MHLSQFHYLPLAPGFFSILIGLLVGLVVILLVLGALRHAYLSLGVSPPTAMLLLSRANAAPLAYIAGSMGTLIGADLTNFDKVAGLGAPVASIGGAGTFDGIFLTGILAVLLAGLYHRRPSQVQV